VKTSDPDGLLTGKDLEGNGRVIVKVISRNLPRGTEDILENR
jgi:hypothetical protein